MLLEVVGPLLVHLHQPFEVGLVAGRFVDDQLALLLGRRVGRILSLGLVGISGGQIGIVLLQFEDGILPHFLLDPLLQGQDGQLQNLHRLDHPRRQNLFLHHPQVLTERKSHKIFHLKCPPPGKGVCQHFLVSKF